MRLKRFTITVAAFFALSLSCAQAQSFGIHASAAWITDCNQANFFNVTGSAPNLIGPAGNVFNNANLGVHTQNTGTLILRGAQVRTFKTPGSANVCNVKMYYRVYLQSAGPGVFNSVDIPLQEECSAGAYPSGGACVAGDQKWQLLNPSLVNLTALAPGNYTLELYYEVTGSHTSTSGCADIVTLNNGGNNYKASFFIQSPGLTSINPSSCLGNNGSITISGLCPGAAYQLSYTDDGANVGPNVFVANAAGQITIPALNKGFYSGFILRINGCATNLFTGIILSDPVYVPVFNIPSPICAGAVPPVLPAVSINGLSGSWSPAVVDNQTAGTYTFTPHDGQCGVPVTITINITPEVVPSFSFGNVTEICGNATVPLLPPVSTNGITGTWSPAVVDNQQSGVYTFTPDNGQCASSASFTVTVNPNITPSFSFSSSLSICEGDGVPVLPATSSNGVSGTWSPAVVSNQHSGSYTFTPDADECATSITLAVTVSPVVEPVFSIAATLSVCGGGTVPSLPAVSDNGISGTWSPAVVSSQMPGTYTFTPSVTGPCVRTFSFSVTITPPVTPAFDFGTSQSACVDAAPPVLPAVSNNGITGTWSPAVIDNQHSGSYTFTPANGQCANPVTLTYEVNPVPTVITINRDTTVYDGAVVPPFNFISTAGAVLNWTNDNPSIGLAASGTGTVPSFTAVNNGTTPVTATVTVTPVINGCTGLAQTYVITVLPLDKDIFVPNVFSPNADGKNDILYVYGNYIDKVDMRIFNQWGQQIAVISSRTQGWDGRHSGSPQPTGVYVYVLKAVLTDGSIINRKGTVTLVR